MLHRLAEVRSLCPAADRASHHDIFNIGSNQLRLIATPHLNRQKCYVREILTHAEHDRWQPCTHHPYPWTTSALACYSTAPLLANPANDEELARLRAALDRLLGEIGDNEVHPLMPWVDAISDRIEAYEAERYPMPEVASPAELLRHLIDMHQLRQAELPEVGSQGVVSEILSGKRRLNARQWRVLADRFGLTAENFLPQS